MVKNCVGDIIEHINNYNLSPQHVALGFHPKYHMTRNRGGIEETILCVEENENGVRVALTMFSLISFFVYILCNQYVSGKGCIILYTAD